MGQVRIPLILSDFKRCTILIMREAAVDSTTLERLSDEEKMTREKRKAQKAIYLRACMFWVQRFARIFELCCIH